ncbi:nicotinate mononucleotide-dependent phosphoribosyltransferase CobT [Deferrisoma palaeochoriense]
MPTAPELPPPLGAVHAPEAAARLWANLRGRPAFACVIGSTDTAEIPGISAAGATPEKRRYTAALDSEFLLFGRPLSLPEIPRNPLGPPSPVVITRAALEALGVTALIVDAGTRVPPQTPHLVLGGVPGRCITTGRALDLPEGLRDRARAAGAYLASTAPWLILAECVPGGTTTAQSLLEGLGIPAGGRVSSSMPGGNHDLKRKVVEQALKAAGLRPGATGREVAAAVGDPMQPVAAWIALEASLRVPVVLAGGTQMAAVAALALRFWQEGQPGAPERLSLATTRWVAEDPAADLAGLLGHLPLEVPAVHCGLDFSGSALPGLQRYEEGLVKEGVGAGAAACAAFAAGMEHDALVRAIEEVVRGLPPA